MFNLGLLEMVALGAIALLVIGPKQLPEVARSLARIMNELKHATSDLTDSLKSVRTDVDNAISDVKGSVGNPQEWVDKVTEDIKSDISKSIADKPQDTQQDENNDGQS